MKKVFKDWVERPENYFTRIINNVSNDLIIKELKIHVHTHIDYPGTYFLTTYGIIAITRYDLKTSDPEEAKKKAMKYLGTQIQQLKMDLTFIKQEIDKEIKLQEK